MNHRNRFPTLRILGAIVVSLVAGATTAAAALVPVDVVIKQGDPLGPSTVNSLNSPFTDGQGRVGFVAALADNQRAIWWNDGAVFFSNEALPEVLTGGESTMGVGNAGEFIYSPSVNGNDAVWTHGGALLVKGDPVPPLPGLYSSFNSRPSMLPDGTAHWIGGTSETPGGTTSNRHLFRATDPTDPNSMVRVLGGGDVIDGRTLTTTASNFNYWFSNDGQHHIHTLDTNDGEHIYLDGGWAVLEGAPTGQGDNWQNFDFVVVNNNGDYIFCGDTDGNTASDEFIAYNGTIALREGDTVDGVTLPSSVSAIGLNNQGRVAHIWTGATEVLFFGPATDLPNSVRVLALGDEIDVDGDEVADYTVTDFNASSAIGPGLDLADDGYVYVEVDILPPGGFELEAILRISLNGSVAVEDARFASAGLSLACAPNPARGSTEVVLRLPQPMDARVTIFDASGRVVRSLASGRRSSGVSRMAWDGRDDRGLPAPAGVYFVRASGAGMTGATRLILIR